MGHWKKPFKSDHLSAADLEGRELVLVIEYVKQEMCKSQSGEELGNVAYFTDKKWKPMRLNVGNSKIVKKFSGHKENTDDWKMIPVSIYVDPRVKFGRDIVEGLRIKDIQPRINTQGASVVTKPKLDPTSPNWQMIVKWVKDGNAIEKVLEKYEVSEQDKITLNAESGIRPETNSTGQGTEVEN